MALGFIKKVFSFGKDKAETDKLKAKRPFLARRSAAPLKRR